MPLWCCYLFDYLVFRKEMRVIQYNIIDIEWIIIILIPVVIAGGRRDSIDQFFTFAQDPCYRRPVLHTHD